MSAVAFIAGAIVFLGGLYFLAFDAFVNGGVGAGLLVSGICLVLTALAIDMFWEWLRR